MSDPRIEKLARVLVRYSIKAQKGQTVAVSGAVAAEPLILAVYEDLLRVGAFPVVVMAPAGMNEAFHRCAKPHHYTTVTPHMRAHARTTDAFIRIYSSRNTRELSAVSPGKQAQLIQASKPISDIIRKKTWTVTLFPTAAYAQDAEMSLRDYEDFVYGATFADEKNPVALWRALKRRQDRLIAKLEGAREVRIAGPGTDLTFSVEGRCFINSDGCHNMPSGEVFTGPVENSAEGHIEYDFPVCHAGREIDGIRLVFRKGVVVEATAKKNEAFLLEMLDIDKGARRLGELGIGTNMKIQRFTKTILFDEKIGGTIHLALGSSYPETGGKNRSALHWDMIKDLRRGGTVYVDGKIFQRNGKFK